MLTADVVVVGAGPAGSAAATTLTSRGLRTILLDRARFPRPKVCGDGLTPRAIAALQRLGVWTRIAPHAQNVGAVRTLDLRTGATRLGPVPSRLDLHADTGAVVRRDVLDHLLCQRAIESGAAFHGGVMVLHISEERGRCIVTGSSDGQPWRCATRTVVLAEGANGRLTSELLGHRNATIAGIALRQYWRCPFVVPTFTICVPLESADQAYSGYGWIFPVTHDLANVGIGLYGVQSGREARAVYRRFVQRLREIAEEFRQGQPCGAVQGGALQSGGFAEGMVVGRVVLAGDAAGVTNPFTGEGIAQALDSGELVALSVVDEFRSPGCLASAIRARVRDTFPETSRLATHLPWLVARSKHFVTDFWSAVSPPTALIAKAARRMALEEGLEGRDHTPDTRIERTWTQCVEAIGADFPILVQLLEAMRRESRIRIDMPLAAFWKAQRGTDAAAGSEVDTLAQLLLLSTLITVVASDTGVGHAECRAGGEMATWATDALALGAIDILMAHFFAGTARLTARLAPRCAQALSETLLSLASAAANGTVRDRLDAVLRNLTTGFTAATALSVATAA